MGQNTGNILNGCGKNVSHGFGQGVGLLALHLSVS